jgi:hypothetical protein
LNLQPILRAAVCAALAAVCLAGAGWLPNQSVAGQETRPAALHGANKQTVESGKLPENYSSKSAASVDRVQDQQTYRPGLRNSFLGHPLSKEELNRVLTQLQRKTGFMQMRFDEAGFLTIDDRSQIAGGSASARELLLATVDGKKSINLQSRNRSPEVAFGRVYGSADYSDWRSEERIAVEQVVIDFADFNHLRGHTKAVEAFDLGFVILHELCHAVLELHDPSAGVSAAGDCETYVNRARRELGMPERQQYGATAYMRKIFAFSPTSKIAELIFAQTAPGREPGRRAKTKRLRLTWDARLVGDIRPQPAPPAVREKADAGVGAP